MDVLVETTMIMTRLAVLATDWVTGPVFLIVSVASSLYCGASGERYIDSPPARGKQRFRATAQVERQAGEHHRVEHFRRRFGQLAELAPLAALLVDH